MKHISFLFTIAFGLVFHTVCAQLDSIQTLPEVVLSDVKLLDFSKGIPVKNIQDSILKENTTALTQVLRNNSLIYFRENGPGGVSSPSFRGTTASQTAVIWNGININSQLNGQTDFNTISVKNYDNIAVRTGGGSIPYGSGAVGGSVHLNNDIRFGNRFENHLAISYASFDTKAGILKSTFATDQLYINVAADYISSENDFDYLDTDQINENGSLVNTNLNANLGFKVSEKHLIKLYHNTFLGTRNFSGTLTAPSDDGYKDRNARTLLAWQSVGDTFENTFRFAHVFEQFEYFPSGLDKDISTIGKAIRYTANHNLKYRLGTGKSIQTIVDYTSVQGDGSNIESATRNIFSGVLLWNHRVNAKLSYGAQLRKEMTNAYKSPLLYGVGGEYALARAYTLQLNASRNFRIPTFNDTFWQGAGAVGNPDLKPESSYQVTLGHLFKFKNVQAGLRTFYIRSNDLIVWRPNEVNIWSPINIAESRNYGVELDASYALKILSSHVLISGRYGYTIAEDLEKETQLIYVPKQKLTGAVAYSWKNVSAHYQLVYVDEVFTTTDNLQTLAGYGVSNVGLSYKLLNKEQHKVSLSLRGRNIFNKNYQTVAFRPNPGRNFLIQTTYTF